MGCERLAPFEALTDYLLALRALLEPEGPASGRLAQRLAVICGRPEDHAGAGRAHGAGDRRSSTRSSPVWPRRTAGSTAWSGSSPSICGRSCATPCAATSRADLVGLADELLAEAAAPGAG